MERQITSTYGKYERLSGEREQYEKERDTDVLVITMAEVESRLSQDRLRL